MKCYNLKCKNELSEDRIKHLDPRSRLRFCARCLCHCRIGKNPIQWKCSTCENILTQNDHELLQLKCQVCIDNRKRDPNYGKM